MNKSKPGTVNMGAVLKAYREIQGELERLDRGQKCLLGQNREMMEQHETERAAWSAERIQMIAINLRWARQCESLIRQKDGLQAFIGRLFMQHGEMRITPNVPTEFFDEADLQRFRRECEGTMHANTGN